MSNALATMQQRAADPRVIGSDDHRDDPVQDHADHGEHVGRQTKSGQKPAETEDLPADQIADAFRDHVPSRLSARGRRPSPANRMVILAARRQFAAPAAARS